MLGEWDYSRKRKFWGAQAASLFFSTGRRKADLTFFAKDFCGTLSESSASCLCPPRAERARASDRTQLTRTLCRKKSHCSSQAKARKALGWGANSRKIFQLRRGYVRKLMKFSVGS